MAKSVRNKEVIKIDKEGLLEKYERSLEVIKYYATEANYISGIFTLDDLLKDCGKKAREFLKEEGVK